MLTTDGSKYHCPLCQSRCRAVGCMFWVETKHNHGECAIRYFVMGLPMPQKEMAPEPMGSDAPPTTTTVVSVTEPTPLNSGRPFNTI